MHYHIVGIAGAGMSAIANLLLDQGHSVSGSDLTENRLTAALQERGAVTHSNHRATHVFGAQAVVATAAVGITHPELVAAREIGIPILKRSDLWREWSYQRQVIAVAGSHGKTTTTAMIAYILTQAGINPGYLIGSESFDLGGNGQWGDPAAPLVIEADEYDFAFLALFPTIGIITNVDWDHPDIYHDEERYDAAFTQFAQQVSSVLLVCGDTEAHGWRPQESMDHQRTTGVSQKPVVLSYGLQEVCDYRITISEQSQQSYSFSLQNRSAHVQKQDAPHTCTSGHPFHLMVPGLHNIRNAAAAIAVADLLGIDMQQTQQALSNFRGTARRFELKGEVGGVTVIDDYAHHPTEVKATLSAARMRYPHRRIVAYLQPHTYSRTQTLMHAWQGAFVDADVACIGNIYAAREQCPPDVSAKIVDELVGKIAASHPHVWKVGSVADATETIAANLQAGDVLITLGAGDGYKIGEEILQRR